VEVKYDIEKQLCGSAYMMLPLMAKDDIARLFVSTSYCRTMQHTVRLTSIHYWVSGNQILCFAPNETIDGRVKKIRSPTCGMV
jgi:hypothetical protein